MSIRISNNSRLRFGNLLSGNGVTFWDLLEVPPIPVQGDDQQYTVIMGDRVDTLAYNFYGDPTLWWVIALANDLEMLPTELNIGQVLRIPSPTYVLQDMFQKVTSGGAVDGSQFQ